MLNQIRKLREAKGLTLEQLARAVGTTNQQISHLELGKRQLTVAWLKKLAEPLGCHPWAIVEPESAPPDPADDDLALRIRGLNPLQRQDMAMALASIEAAGAPPSGEG